MSHLVIALASEYETAKKVAERLHGVPDQHFIVLAAACHHKDAPFEGLCLVGRSRMRKVSEGALKGGLIAGLSSAVMIVIPFVGPFVFAAAAPFAAVGGAAIGALAGAVTDSLGATDSKIEETLREIGIPEPEALRLHSRMGEGDYLIAIQCPDQQTVDRTTAILKEFAVDESFEA